MIAWIAWKIVCLLARILLRIFSHFQIEGTNNLENPKKPVIFVANHKSFLDPVCLGAALPWNYKLIPIKFIVKKEYEVPPLCWIIKLLGSFFVDTKKLVGAKRGLKILRNGGTLGIFPEGTRSLDGKIQQFEPGATFLALKSGARVIPVYISGTFRQGKGIDSVLPKIWEFLRRKYKIKVVFGKPFNLQVYSGYKIFQIIGENEKVGLLTLELEKKIQNLRR